MKNILPKYSRPLDWIKDPYVDPDKWNDAIELYDNWEIRESIISVINYMNSNLLKWKDLKKDIKILHNQWSSNISIELNNKKIKVEVPFLKITDKTNRIALLRKIAEINYYDLTLPQIILEDTKLFFRSEIDIELAQHYSVYDIIRQCALNADKYDDIFIDKYKAEFLNKPEFNELSDKNKDIVINHIREILKDYKEHVEYFKKKWFDNFEWDAIIIALLQISNMSYINWKLRTDLIENIDMLFNGDMSFNLRRDKWTSFIKKIINMSDEELLKNIYHTELLISLRWRSSPTIMVDVMNDFTEIIDKYINSWNTFALAYYLQWAFLKILYDYNLDKNYKESIIMTLEKVSWKKPDDIYKELVELYNAIREKEVRQFLRKKQTFFKKLFW